MASELMRNVIGLIGVVGFLLWLLFLLDRATAPAQRIPTAKVSVFDWDVEQIEKEFENGWLQITWTDGREYSFRLNAISALKFFPEDHPLARNGLPGLEVVCGGNVTRLDLSPGSKLPVGIFKPVPGLERQGEVTIRHGVNTLKAFDENE